jgi:hypothetical protein
MSPWSSALRATSEGEQHAPERRLEGEASPQDECAWLRNAMVIHKKRASPYGEPGP